MYSLGADYRHALARGEASLDVIWQHSDGYSFTPDNVVRQRPYNNVNASLSWSTSGHGFTLTLWGRNLANALVLQTMGLSQFGFDANYAPPRTYGITLGSTF